MIDAYRVLKTFSERFRKAWSYFTVEDFQNVFKSWIERLTWVIENNGGAILQKSLGR
jgi:hypothetical protein